jgi:hypothetical protein
MPKKKTAPEQKPATHDGILQKAAKAIGSVVGTLAVTTGIVHAEEPPKKAAKAKRAASTGPRPAVKKRAKKTAAAKKPAAKRRPPAA